MPFSVPVNLNATNNFGVASFIVDASPGSGTHTSISNAISDILTLSLSNQTIFIRPGTYTENFTLPATINLAAFSCDAITPNVTILGKITCNDAGSRTISGIRLQTNNDFYLVVSGTLATVLNLNYCFFNCTNNTGMSYSNSSILSNININYCMGDLITTGIAFNSSSGVGSINYFYCNFLNSGNSTTPSSNSSGTVNVVFSSTFSGFSCSLSGVILLEHVSIENGVINVAGLTTSGTGSATVRFTRINSASASCISIGTGTSIAIANCILRSTNTNAITGAGTLYSANISYIGSSANINTTTQNVFQSNNTINRTATSATPYTVLSTDYFISVDASGGPKQVNLPNVPSTNQVFIVKDRLGNAAANNITVTTPGGAVTIDGSTIYVININKGSATFIYNGSAYEVY